MGRTPPSKMERKRRDVAPPLDDLDGVAGGVEQYRDFVVDGEIFQALDLGRRLLQLATDHARRADAALLLLERLRSNRDDSSDHANALLRVLANYATPTKELTEELLSLLFFCEHRVQIIHHLSKLTYQSRECVWLVLDAYIELLSSDRSLLVPILGSLADLPLTTADKALVVDATESLLDAASEEDVPAVVQSLLSMLVPAAATRIVTKIRGQCNRLLASSTLSLTFDVIMRHAVAGSGVLTAFIRAIRQNNSTTPFDVIFLALLLSRPSENSAAVRAISSLATRGTLHRRVVHETLRSLRDLKWHDALRGCIRLSSALLSACFNSYHSSGVSSTIYCAIDMLGYLILYRTTAQEEALSLMMSMVSQPQRLALSSSKKRYTATSQALSWNVAHTIAAQLAHIVKTQPASLAPFAHIFLDHLYAIAASSSQLTFQSSTEDTETSYPASILASLCHTMVVVTKHEPGMIPLLMITIQKQLVVPIQAGPSGISAIGRSHSSSIVQLKQLMAVFLAGEMLVQGVGEKSDRSSLLTWIQKLLASAALSDETTTHVVRLLGSKTITSVLPSADRDATASLLFAAFTRLGFGLTSQNIIDSRVQSNPTHCSTEFLPGLADQSPNWITTSLVFDVVTYVRVSRLGEEPVGWHSLIDYETPPNSVQSVENSIRAKTEMLPVLMETFSSAASLSSRDCDTQEDRALVCSFALPSVGEDTFGERLPSTLWCYASALQIAVVTTNALAIKQEAKATVGAKGMSETIRQRKRLLSRVQVCWTLHKRLRALLEEASSRLKAMSTDHGNGRREVSSASWLKLQIDVIEKQIQSNAMWNATSHSTSSLSSLGERLSLQAVSAVFEGLWKNHSSTVESGLEIELFRAFPARLRIQTTDAHINTDPVDPTLGFQAMEALVNTQDGKRTLKYLARRVLDYCELLASLDNAEGEVSDGLDSDTSRTLHWVLTGVKTLCTALRSIIEVCRGSQEQRITTGRGTDEGLWEETAMELFAKGASDVRLRRTGEKRSSSTSWYTSCETLFRSLTNALVQSQHGDVACELMSVLLCLTGHTRRTNHLSQISLSLLHCPYPSSQSHPSSSVVKSVRKLPVLDPTISASITQLLRPMPQKYHHLVHFIIGAWAAPSTLSAGLNHVSYLLECVDALISSSITKRGLASKIAKSRKREAEKRKDAHDKEPDAEDDINGWIARDGEHRVLKNLTHDSFPVFLESILACLVSAPLRAHPSESNDSRGDANPFLDLIGTLTAISRCLQIVVAAELSGFNLPLRTSLTVLRSGPTITRNVEQAIATCVEWREEGVDGKSRVSSIGHLQYLIEVAHGVVGTIEEVAFSFQERVVVTMQKNSQTQVPSTDGDDEGSSKTSRWSNDLLRKTYQNQFQRRKPLSRSESKLFPFFTHAAERLKAFVGETAGTYRCELAHDVSATALSRSLLSIRLGDDQLDSVLGLLTATSAVVDANAINNEPNLEANWSRITPSGELGQTDVNDDEEHSDVDEDEKGVVDEETDQQPLRLNEANKKFEFKRTNEKVHTLIPQKKRVKTS